MAAPPPPPGAPPPAGTETRRKASMRPIDIFSLGVHARSSGRHLVSGGTSCCRDVSWAGVVVFSARCQLLSWQRRCLHDCANADVNPTELCSLDACRLMLCVRALVAHGRRTRIDGWSPGICRAAGAARHACHERRFNGPELGYEPSVCVSKSIFGIHERRGDNSVWRGQVALQAWRVRGGGCHWQSVCRTQCQYW